MSSDRHIAVLPYYSIVIYEKKSIFKADFRQSSTIVAHPAISVTQNIGEYSESIDHKNGSPDGKHHTFLTQTRKQLL